MNISEIDKYFEWSFASEDIIYFLGVVLLALWLRNTRLGTRALINIPLRRNDMPFYLPLIPLAIWLFGTPLLIGIQEYFFTVSQDWQEVLSQNIIASTGALIALIVVIILVRRYFVRGLKGFGLNPKTIPMDFFAGIINLISIYPVILFVVVLTILIGQWLWGDKFHLPQHEELESLVTYPQISVKMMIFITASIVAPLFEEVLFRGLFQTLVRNYIGRPWPAIFICAMLFALSHANSTHWPALFFLGVCMGYAYEKSGSLFRPIFIHSLFNTASIVATLYQA